MFVSSHAVQPDGTGLAIAGVDEQRPDETDPRHHINEGTYKAGGRIYSNKTATWAKIVADELNSYDSTTSVFMCNYSLKCANTSSMHNR